MIANDNLISQIQTEVADILNADYELSSVDFIIENRRDIESEITTRLKKTGLCGTIMTPTLTMQGITADRKDIVYQIDDLVVQVTEYVPINRATNKLSCQTCQDIAIRVADVLGGPTTTNYQNFQLVDIQTGEDSGLLVSKVTFRCLAQSDLSAMPAPYDPGEKIPFATKIQLDEVAKRLQDEIDNLPIVDAYTKQESDDKFQLKGDYATKSDLNEKLDKTNGTLSVYYNPDNPSQIVFDDSVWKVGIDPTGFTYDAIDGVDKSLYFPMDEGGIIMTDNSTYNKDTINDKINEFAAHYLTWKDDDGHFVQFKSHGSLPNPEKGSLLWARLNHTASNPQFWYGDDPHTPDKNDYCVILEDETHDNETTRYSFVGDWPDGKWRYQYTINETALNTDQWAAINSTATKAKIDQIATNTSDIQTLNGKVQTIDSTLNGYQDTLLSGITEDDQEVSFYILTKSI